jgi:hypothetical protein
MTSNKKLICALAFILFFSVTSLAKSKCVPKVYAFGFAASFNDSTVYFTDIQELDSVYMESKTNFIEGRNNYSYQLRDYLAAHGNEHRTCIFMYNIKRSELEKRFVKMKKKYRQKARFDIKYITLSDFSFKRIDHSEQMDLQKDNKADKKMKMRKNPEMRPPMNGGRPEHDGMRPPM